MKNLLIICLLALSGCATTRNAATVNLPYAELESYAICRGVVTLAASPQDRIDINADIFAVATAGYTLTGGAVPTPAQFEGAIKLVTPHSAEWANLVSQFGNLWAIIYPNVKDDPKLALDYINKICAGAIRATKVGMNP